MSRVGLAAAIAFVATVWLANWAVQRFGVVSVGFGGLTAPAGVWFVGLAFSLRDVCHRELGRNAVVVCIAAGAALSYLISGGYTIPGGHVSLALASGIAFLFSETADLVVYERVRARGWLPAVATSNVVGLVLDSVVFLWLAFGSAGRAFLAGQCVGKAWMTLLAIGVLALIRRRIGEVPA